MTFASHPSEFFCHVVDLAGPPPPPRIFLPVMELGPAAPRAASHAGPPGSDGLSEVLPGPRMHRSSGPATAPVRESGINGVWRGRERGRRKEYMTLEGEEARRRGILCQRGILSGTEAIINSHMQLNK